MERCGDEMKDRFHRVSRMSRMSRVSRIALVAAGSAVALASVACDGPTLPPRASSSVYDFRLQGDTLHVFHWPNGKEVRVFIVQNPDSSLNTQLASAFEKGAAQW